MEGLPEVYARFTLADALLGIETGPDALFSTVLLEFHFG